MGIQITYKLFFRKGVWVHFSLHLYRNEGKGGKINDVRYLNEAKFKAGREVSHLHSRYEASSEHERDLSLMELKRGYFWTTEVSKRDGLQTQNINGHQRVGLCIHVNLRYTPMKTCLLS